MSLTFDTIDSKNFWKEDSMEVLEQIIGVRKCYICRREINIDFDNPDSEEDLKIIADKILAGLKISLVCIDCARPESEGENEL